MIFRMIGGQVIPMPNLHEEKKFKTSKNVLSPLAMEHISSRLLEHAYRPNFTCKSCGKRIWRCESIHKDLLLLEEFGPPWNTHSCAEVDYLLKKVVPEYTKQKTTQTSSKILENPENLTWYLNGWRPVKKPIIEPSSFLDYMELLFFIGKTKGKVFLKKSDLKINWTSVETARERVRTACIFVRIGENRTYALSILDERLRTIHIAGYSLIQK